jgi:hypothetical protein
MGRCGGNRDFNAEETEFAEKKEAEGSSAGILI